MTTWLPGAKVVDLHPAIGNGPFNNFYGVILHVNVDESGTPDSFWGNGNPNQVCPNFQVYKDGSIHQMLPLDWQPWCQIDGNFNYAAIETAGLPNEPLTAAQIAACGQIVKAYRDQFGMPLQTADSPGQRGLGTHAMGGPAWGGHPCPGTIRANQRADILAAARGATPTPPNLLEQIMALDPNSADYKTLVANIATAVWQQQLTYTPTTGKPTTTAAASWLVNADVYANKAAHALTDAAGPLAAVAKTVQTHVVSFDATAAAQSVLAKFRAAIGA